MRHRRLALDGAVTNVQRRNSSTQPGVLVAAGTLLFLPEGERGLNLHGSLDSQGASMNWAEAKNIQHFAETATYLRSNGPRGGPTGSATLRASKGRSTRRAH